MRQLLLSTVTVITLAATGCGRETERATRTATEEGQISTAPAGTRVGERDRALVRFVNADPGQQSLDLWFGEHQAFSSVAYKTVTPYAEIPSERREFRMRPAGQSTDLATNSEGLSAGMRYTLVAMRSEDGSSRLIAVTDDLTPPEEGRAKVRVINAAPAAGALDVVAANRPEDEIFDSVNFSTATSWEEIEPAAGALTIRRGDQERAAAGMRVANLQPGRLYTIVVTGQRGALDTIRIEDQLMGQAAAATR
jgi:hypothetical protein